MSAELDSKIATIIIVNNSFSDRWICDLLGHLGYLVKEVRCSEVMIEIADLVILGRELEQKILGSDGLSEQVVLRSPDRKLQGQETQQFYETFKVNYPDIPVIFLTNYGELSDLQTSIFLSDVSDRLQSSQKIKHLKQQNLELTDQILKVRDTTELALKAKSEFLTRISHELRSPLNAILGFSQLMNWDKLLTTEQRGYTEIIYEGGKRLLSLINDILEMSKIESHQMEVDKKVFVLREMINDLKHIFSPKAEKKNLNLILKIAEEVPVCLQSDEIKVRQILVNILNNSIELTQRGSITLNTFLGSDILTEKLHLIFEIEDTGAGITRIEIDEIFEPFGQRGSGEKTGLSLSISKHFAQLLGGELKVASELGEGTTFTLSIPVEIPYNSAASYAGDRFVKLENHKTESDLSILLAEDSFVDQKVLVRILNKMGYAVDVAGDGLEVLAALEQKFYNIILMDVQMPNMDGIETTKEILQRFGVESPIIIALTAAVMPEDRSRCLNAGMHDYMTKPIRPKQLKAVLDHWEQKLAQT